MFKIDECDGICANPLILFLRHCVIMTENKPQFKLKNVSLIEKFVKIASVYYKISLCAYIK